MVACIGEDAFGATARESLRAEGVNVDLFVTSQTPTGCAFISVDARGENAITVASGANGLLPATAIPDATLHPGTIAVLQMEVPFAASLAVARRVRTVGGRVIWNFAPVPPDFSANQLAEMLAATDILVVNEHEALAAAANGCEAARLARTSDYEAAGRKLAEAGCTCIVTAGATGALAFHPGGRRSSAAATPVEPVDTTGAGDTFVGILAAGLDAGDHFDVAIQRACHGASLACLGVGAQAAMPTRAMIGWTTFSSVTAP